MEFLPVRTRLCASSRRLQSKCESRQTKWLTRILIANRFLGVDALWALAMALNVYLALFRGWTAQRMQAQEWKYFVGAYGLSFIPALTYLFLKDHSRGRAYGPALVSTPCSISGTLLIVQTALVLDPVRMGLPSYGNPIRHCLVRTNTPQKNLPQTKLLQGRPPLRLCNLLCRLPKSLAQPQHTPTPLQSL